MLDSIKLKQYEYNFYGRSEDKFIKTCKKISKIKNKEASSLLADVLDNKSDISFKEKKALIEAFSEIGNPAVEVLEQRLIMNGKINYIAVNSLSHLANSTTVPKFIELFIKTNDGCFINALGNINTEETANFLKNIVNNINSDFRNEAVQSLLKIDFPNKDLFFEKILYDSNKNLRESAAKHIFKQSDDRIKILKNIISQQWDSSLFYKDENLTKEILLNFINDKDNLLRLNILKIFLNFSTLPCEAVQFLYDPLEDIRKTAVKKFSERKIYNENIVFLLTDDSKIVRNAAEIAIIENSAEFIIILLTYILKTDFNKEELFLITSVQDVIIRMGNKVIDLVNQNLENVSNEQPLMRLIEIVEEIGNGDSVKILKSKVGDYSDDIDLQIFECILNLELNIENYEFVLSNVINSKTKISESKIEILKSFYEDSFNKLLSDYNVNFDSI